MKRGANKEVKSPNKSYLKKKTIITKLMLKKEKKSVQYAHLR